MGCHNLLSRFVRSLVLGVSILFVPESFSADGSDDTERSVFNKLKFLEWLVQGSPTQVRIIESNDESARALMVNAKEALEEARVSYASAKHDAAESQIDRGIREMTAASKLVKDLGRVNTARVKLYRQLHERIDSFVIAYDRIVTEKQGQQDNNILANDFLDKESLHALVEEAETHAIDDNYVLANHLMRKAADMIERSLRDLRDKEVLHHELSFNSMQEEYAYEVERNLSYVMLLGLIKSNNTHQDSKINYFDKVIGENSVIRKQAEQLANAGDYKRGIRIMENSTEKLSRVLSMSGAMY